MYLKFANQKYGILKLFLIHNFRIVVDLNIILDDLPDTFSGIFEIIKTESGDLIRLKSLGGTSGLNLINRFTVGNDEIKNYAKRISEIENEIKPNHIIAEIVHLPDNVTGNILKRTNFKKYEIPILTSTNEKNSILLKDISIFMDSGNLILMSDKLNKEIIPRLSTAHNFTRSDIPIYRFLCDFQTQNINATLSPNFIYFNQIFPFIPRISYKGVILSPARWELQRECFQNMLGLVSNHEKLLKSANEFCKQNMIPKLVLLIQNDNELLVNFNNIDCLTYFLQLIKNQGTLILQEFLFDFNLYKTGVSTYTNEIVVTYYKKTNG